MVAASNLSSVPGLRSSSSSQAHLTASARFRVRAPGPYPAGYPTRPAGGGRPSRPGFPLPFGRRHSLLGHPIPAEGLGLPCGRLTGNDRPDLDGGYHVPHARAATGVGASSIPRTAVLIPAGRPPQPAPAALSAASPCTPLHIPSCGVYRSRGINGGSRDSPVRSAPRL